MKDDNNIAYLDIRTWVGTSAWNAVHYGKITCGDEVFELERVMSKEDAEELNAGEQYSDPIFQFEYSEGEKTIRFMSEKSLIESAINQYKLMFPYAEFLVLGQSYIAEAQPIIAGDMTRPEVQRINQIFEEQELINGWDGKQRKKMQTLNDEWKELFNQLIEY